jgi:hypothetical protein
MSEGGRKRLFEEALKEDTIMTIDAADPSQTNSKEDDSTIDIPPHQQVRPSDPLPFLPLRKLRLEAVFHPKFENENQQQKSIRERMKERCAKGDGYLEVSIKHSGSLLLWSGGPRYYSKNSASNKFSAVGEILLRKHFVRAYWGSSENEDAAILTEQKYQECSAYVEEHRLTLSFEVVTTVLGDHGAQPNHDFLILTAVADRNRVAAGKPSSVFYSTVELMELAQRFRLPHNDCWVFAEQPAVNAVFDIYDNIRETGTTSTVMAALTKAANLAGSASNSCDCFVQSMYPHAYFQGEIMEGIVIRYVPCPDRVVAMERMARLSRQSQEILQAVPPSLPSCDELLTKRQKDRAEAEVSALSPLLTANLRQLHNETRAAYTKKGEQEFDARVQTLISDSPAHTLKRQQRQTERIPRDLSSSLPAWIDDLVMNSSRLDLETRQIASLIQSLSKLSKSVVYSIIREHRTGSDEQKGPTATRYLCIVHVLHDQTFQKFHRLKEKGDMSLFRGFSFEMIGGADVDGTAAGSTSTTSPTKSETASETYNGCSIGEDDKGEEETLMLKMKFLPYMVRTIYFGHWHL